MAASISDYILIEYMQNGIIFETEQLGTDSVLASGVNANTTNAFISYIRDTTQPLEKAIQEILRQCSPPTVCHVSYVTCHMGHVKWEELVGGL